jgi:F-type H+-transporting ATPase subunit b
MQQSAQFASRLLAEAAGPELEMRLLNLLLDSLSTLSPEQMTALRTQWGQPPEAILVASAYPLPEDRRQRLQETLAAITELKVPVQYAQKTDLLAGVQITVGAWILNANVRDELQGFAEFAHAAR